MTFWGGLFLTYLFAEGECVLKIEEDDDDDDRDDVFTVEIQRGPHGLGLALVDGTVRLLSGQPSLHLYPKIPHAIFFNFVYKQKTALRMSGIYVKSLVPDSPAALCRHLKTGDRILAVNGVSLVGLDYSV